MVEVCLLAVALSADNFVVSIGYGNSGTRLSVWTVTFLNLFCSTALVSSAKFGKRLMQSAEPKWETVLGAGCFFLIGSIRIFGEWKKRREKPVQSRKQREKPGTDIQKKEIQKKKIGILEGGLLAVSMSVDGILSGVFAADLAVSLWKVFLVSFAVGMAAMHAGYAIGRKTGEKSGGSGTFFSGILFWILAVLKLI